MNLWIYRPEQILDFVQDYRLYADGKFITRVKRGQRFSGDVADIDETNEVSILLLITDPEALEHKS